jgi:hypothetical protein
MAVKAAISEKFDFEFNLNPDKPRRGAFEIKFVKGGGGGIFMTIIIMHGKKFCIQCSGIRTRH